MDYGKLAREIGAEWQPIGELIPQVAEALERAALERAIKELELARGCIPFDHRLPALRARLAELKGV